jgi:hypothetical protein
MNQAIFRILLIFLLLFNAVGAYFGSISMLLDPSGAMLHVTPDMLRGSPFKDFLAPGIILLLANGILPTVAGLGLILRKPALPLPGLPFWQDRLWAWSLAFASGVGLMIWITVQIILLGYWPEFPIQGVYGGLGIVITVLALLPSVRAFYKIPAAD